MTNDEGFDTFPVSPQDIDRIRVALEQMSPHFRLLSNISTKIKIINSVLAKLDVEMMVGFQSLVERYITDTLGDLEFPTAWEPPNWRGFGGLKWWKQFQCTSRRTLLLAFCSRVYASALY
jgi:hypothetical protein